MHSSQAIQEYDSARFSECDSPRAIYFKSIFFKTTVEVQFSLKLVSILFWKQRGQDLKRSNIRKDPLYGRKQSKICKWCMISWRREKY